MIPIFYGAAVAIAQETGVSELVMQGAWSFNESLILTAFGGTSILIMISVALDTMGKIESQLMMHNYEGFFKQRILSRVKETGFL